MTCSVQDCEAPASKRGMCNAHYIRQRRHGDVNHLVRPQRHATEEDRAAAKKAAKRRDYEKNKDAYIARARAWQKKNDYHRRPDVLAKSRKRTKEWLAANPERAKEAAKRYREDNRGEVNAMKARYRAARRQACPHWLTPEQKRQIVDIYREAARLTKLTGERYDVDHIVPLQGKTVCGLHVPWNLRVITRDENNRRPRIWSP